jgi:hypothetical protein
LISPKYSLFVPFLAAGILNAGNLLALKNERDTTYVSAYRHLDAMLEGREILSFKKAVFATENAYYGDSLSYAQFDEKIQWLTAVSKQKDKYSNRNVREVIIGQRTSRAREQK